MSNLGWLGVVLIAAFIAIMAIDRNESLVIVESAKAGLQQCVVEHKTVWQKECK